MFPEAQDDLSGHGEILSYAKETMVEARLP